MIPDKTYRIEPVTVFRLIDEEGKVVLTQDDDGYEYPRHFGSYTEAVEHRQYLARLPFHGPMTEEEQKRADQMAPFYALLKRQMSESLLGFLKRPSVLMPEASGNTIFFHELGRQDEGFGPGERGNA